MISIISLIVSALTLIIVAGIAVLYLTKEVKTEEKQEQKKCEKPQSETAEEVKKEMARKMKVIEDFNINSI